MDLFPLSMSNLPKPPNQIYPVERITKHQAWLILIVLAIGLVIDRLSHHTDFIVSKNLLAGSVLAWFGQLVFAKISLGVTGYHQRRQIVHRFYLAHLVKWIMTLIGFIIIFKWLRPLQALWVFAGFILLQFGYALLMYRYRR